MAKEILASTLAGSEILRKAIADGVCKRDELTGTLHLPKEAWEAVLPVLNEGLETPTTQESMKTHLDQVGQLHNMFAHAVGTDSATYAKDKPELKSVVATMELAGQNAINVEWTKSKENRNPATGEVKTVYGTLKSGIDIVEGAPGEYKRIKTAIMALADAEYGE